VEHTIWQSMEHENKCQLVCVLHTLRPIYRLSLQHVSMCELNPGHYD